jgi:hypothetical protein
MGYIPADDWARVCDVCGRLRPGKCFRIVSGVWICDRHPSYVPRQVLEKVPYINLGAPVTIAGAKPWNPIDTYEVSEGQILNLIALQAPADSLDVTNGAGAPAASTVQAAAWGCLYLYDVITEAKRPTRWVTLARLTLKKLADWLYDHQWGGPVTGTYTNAMMEWGSYNRRTVGEEFFSEDSGAAGLALVRAYQLLGTPGYLTAARACAWFLRSCQCGDKKSLLPCSTDPTAGVSPRHHGAWTHNVLLNGGNFYFDNRYYPGDLIGLEFLQAFQQVAGDESIGSSSTIATFSSSRAAPVSTAIAEALAFWTQGVFSVDDGVVINGFSAATPREFFSSYPAATNIPAPTFGTLANRGSWQYQDGPLSSGTAITSLGWAIGLRALRALGVDVTGIFDWLMGFGSAPAFEASVTSHLYGTVTWNTPDDRGIYAGTRGTYNPKTALATLLQVRTAGGGAVALNGSGLYDLATVGLLASLYSTRQQAAFGQLKDALVIPRPRWREGFDPRDGKYLYLGPLGVSGLSLQPYSDASLNRYESIPRAAMTAGIYRQPPQAYTGRGVGA